MGNGEFGAGLDSYSCKQGLWKAPDWYKANYMTQKKNQTVKQIKKHFPTPYPGLASGKNLCSPLLSLSITSLLLYIMFSPSQILQWGVGWWRGWGPEQNGFCMLLLTSHSFPCVAAGVALSRSPSMVPLPQVMPSVVPSPSEQRLLCHWAHHPRACHQPLSVQ